MTAAEMSTWLIVAVSVLSAGSIFTVAGVLLGVAKIGSEALLRIFVLGGLTLMILSELVMLVAVILQST